MTRLLEMGQLGSHNPEDSDTADRRSKPKSDASDIAVTDAGNAHNALASSGAATNQMRNARVSPIYRLPVELLPQVFQDYLLGDSAVHYYRRLTTLQLVSTLWYTVVQGCPMLWSTICGDVSVTQVEKLLSKSKDHPLTIKLAEEEEEDVQFQYGRHATGEMLKVVDLVSGHMHRWRSASFVVQDSSIDLTHEAPLLETLSLETATVLELPALFLNEVTPRLRSLKLRGLKLDWTSSQSFPKLCDLALTGCSQDELTLHDTQVFLTKAPELRHLYLEVENEFLGAIPRSKVHLHHLESLTIVSDIDWILEALRMIDSPNLRELNVRAGGLTRFSEDKQEYWTVFKHCLRLLKKHGTDKVTTDLSVSPYQVDLTLSNSAATTALTFDGASPGTIARWPRSCFNPLESDKISTTLRFDHIVFTEMLARALKKLPSVEVLEVGPAVPFDIGIVGPLLQTYPERKTLLIRGPRSEAGLVEIVNTIRSWVRDEGLRELGTPSPYLSVHLDKTHQGSFAEAELKRILGPMAVECVLG